MILLQTSDFEAGKYCIPDADSIYNEADVQETIDTYEKKYIYELLGVTEGDKFITWVQLTSPPVNVHYTKIKNSFSQDDSACFGIIQSLGMTEYLKAGIFYEYVKDSLEMTPAGVVNTDTEAAKKQGPDQQMRFAENKFNDALDTAEAIQWYCQDNASAFPDFNGQRIAVKGSNFFI